MNTNQPDRDHTALAAFYPQGDDSAEKYIAVRTPAVRIGQGPQNDLVLDDDTVSTRHARLEFADGGWRITDLESKNGTFVDGIRLAPGVPTPLVEHSGIAFGAVKLAFRTLEGVDPDAAAAEYTPPPPAKTSSRKTGFRLPVWLVLVVLLFIALLVFLFLTFSGDAGTPQQPVVEPVTAMLDLVAVGYPT
jgi:hypothetical protein